MGIPNANNRSWDIPHHYGNDHMYHIRKACILSVGIPTCNVGIPSQKWEHPRHTWERDWECPHFIYMWAFPVVTWAFPVATGNAHITHVPTGNAHVTTGMRLGMPTHTIYVGDGNDHPYYVWKCHGPSHFLYGNDHSYHVWKWRGPSHSICWEWPLLPYMEGVGFPMFHPVKYGKDHLMGVLVLPISSMGMAILTSKNGHPLHVNTQEEPWIARSFLPLETHSKQMAMTVVCLNTYYKVN
ncbi:hypothetical protein B0H14DRAFT_2591985 [Mycena olivaceomarginata]|nr:hypothetical protein B0H14DRAFT_2591985 [Mycena olivaceomarginata]